MCSCTFVPMTTRRRMRRTLPFRLRPLPFAAVRRRRGRERVLPAIVRLLEEVRVHFGEVLLVIGQCSSSMKMASLLAQVAMQEPQATQALDRCRAENVGQFGIIGGGVNGFHRADINAKAHAFTTRISDNGNGHSSISLKKDGLWHSERLVSPRVTGRCRRARIVGGLNQWYVCKPRATHHPADGRHI